MPTINLTQVALLSFKLTVMGIIFAIIVSFMSSFSNTVSSILTTLFSSVGSVGSLNLGYVAGAIGADIFINNVLSSVYIAGSVYVSAMVSILIFKHSLNIYKMIMAS